MRSSTALLLRLLFVIAIVLPCSGLADALSRESYASGSLDVTITGFQSEEGRVLVSLFRAQDGFPEETGQAFRTATLPIHGITAGCLFPDLPPGRYALAIVHDKNGDSELDTNFFGIPVEPYGFSNNARRTFGPPSFDEAEIGVSSGPTHIQIALDD